MLNAIYLRVSTNKQDTFIQEQEISTFLQYKGITDIQIYRDEGYSGKNTDRPALKQLLNDVKQGAIKTIVIWKLDRLARSLPDLLTTLTAFKTHGVTFISIKESIDLSTPQGVLMMQLIGAFAEFERSIIRERTITGANLAKKRGVKFGRPSKLSEGTKAQMLTLKAQGFCNADIAAKLEVNVGSVYHFLNAAKKLNSRGSL